MNSKISSSAYYLLLPFPPLDPSRRLECFLSERRHVLFVRSCGLFSLARVLLLFGDWVRDFVLLFRASLCSANSVLLASFILHQWSFAWDTRQNIVTETYHSMRFKLKKKFLLHNICDVTDKFAFISFSFYSVREWSEDRQQVDP